MIDVTNEGSDSLLMHQIGTETLDSEVCPSFLLMSCQCGCHNCVCTVHDIEYWHSEVFFIFFY